MTMMEAAASTALWGSSYLPGTAATLAALVAYMTVVRLLRFRRVRSMKMPEVDTDPSAVYRKTALFEFPFTVTKALEFSLFRTYGVPSISSLYHKNGQFRLHAGKRYDDTDLLLKEYSENNPASDRSSMAIARINAIHAMYSDEISNADMLYTMSLFITEPMTWIDRLEWRCSTDVEKAAFLAHFQEMGDRMGIRGVRKWKTWGDAKAHQQAYEAEHYRYQECNTELVKQTLDLFLSPLPSLLHSFGRAAVCVLMDPPLLTAVGLPEAPIVLKWVVNGVFMLRAVALRFFTLPRISPNRRTPATTGHAGIPACCPASSSHAKVASNEDLPLPGDADVVRKPLYNQFNDTKLGCLFYKKGYQIAKVGTKACPSGRLMRQGVPIYAGKGGGGRNTNVNKSSSVVPADGQTLEAKKQC